MVFRGKLVPATVLCLALTGCRSTPGSNRAEDAGALLPVMVMYKDIADPNSQAAQDLVKGLGGRGVEVLYTRDEALATWGLPPGHPVAVGPGFQTYDPQTHKAILPPDGVVKLVHYNEKYSGDVIVAPIFQSGGQSFDVTLTIEQNLVGPYFQFTPTNLDAKTHRRTSGSPRAAVVCPVPTGGCSQAICPKTLKKDCTTGPDGCSC